MTYKKENSSGSVYSTLEWLNNHFSVKSQGRYNYVAELPVQSGFRVLDLGCANGSWSRLIAERVGLLGQVIAIDHDAELIHQAKSSIQNTHLDGRLRFEVVDIGRDFAHQQTNFNVVTAFNVGSLLSDPFAALKKIAKMLKALDGTLILKDSAISSDFYWPMESDLASEIHRKLSCGGKIGGYDPNFGLSCRSMLNECGFSILETKLNSYPFTYPYEPEQRQYISKNAHMIIEVDDQLDVSRKLKHWLTEVMSEKGTFFENKNSIYTTTEFTHICSIS